MTGARKFEGGGPRRGGRWIYDPESDVFRPCPVTRKILGMEAEQTPAPSEVSEPEPKGEEDAG